LCALFTPSLCAEGLSGTWTVGAGPAARTYVFKVQGDRFHGIVCGPCDDPASVFRIEDGRLLDSARVIFFIRYDIGGPLFGKYGPYRDQVTADRAGNQMTLRAQREGESENPVTTVLKRVVDTYAGVDVVAPAGLTSGSSSRAPSKAPSKPAPIEGKWIAAGRVSQQNFILKVRDNTVWGLICGPCDPAGVFMIDDGMFDGNAMTFYQPSRHAAVHADDRADPEHHAGDAGRQRDEVQMGPRRRGGPAGRRDGADRPDSITTSGCSTISRAAAVFVSTFHEGSKVHEDRESAVWQNASRRRDFVIYNRRTILYADLKNAVASTAWPLAGRGQCCQASTGVRR